MQAVCGPRLVPGARLGPSWSSLQRRAGQPGGGAASSQRVGRCIRRRRHPPPLVCASAAADFADLRAAAAEAVANAQAKLPKLEKAKRAAEQHREPAAEAERHWQELHGQLTSLQKETASAMKSLREAVVNAAGGEAVATQAMLQRHVAERLSTFRANHGLAGAQVWKEYNPRDLSLHSIPGGKMVYRLAAAELDGERYAVVALGISNPFLFDNLRSLIMHWGVTEGVDAAWAQPPKGWHSSPGVSTPAGERAWETVFGAYTPVLHEEQVLDAAVYSVVLQIPLEGILELHGGVKCVLRRTDHGQPEWIKGGHHNNADFFLDFGPAIKLFERERRKAQAVAIAAARAAARVAALERAGAAQAASKGGVQAPPPVQAKGGRAPVPVPEVIEAPPAGDVFGEGDLEALMNEPMALVEEEEEVEEPAGPELPRWVGQVQQFIQLSDLPTERSASEHAKCLHAIATAVAEARPDGASGGRDLLNRCLEVERLLQQTDLLELNTRAAQQEKEQLQALYKQACDESARLTHELTHAADTARRTAVKLRGRETEVTQRDLEAVAQQAAMELLKKSGGGGFWPFKEEERQLVFVQQKTMDVSGIEAKVIVQVFVEGTKAAVEAATAPPLPETDSDSEDEEDEVEAEAEAEAEPAAAATKDEAAAAAATAGAVREEGAAGEEGDGVAGNGAEPAAAVVPEAKKAKKAKKEKKEKKKVPGFEHVVLGIAVGEAFPDDRLKTPLIMHMGCVAHQYAKWRSPPEKWSCSPIAESEVGASASQVPFQRYRIAAEGGASVFVDPTLFALALRFPLKDCLAESIRGIEFVLKTEDGQWLSWQHGPSQVSNFYAELPVPMR